MAFTTLSLAGLNHWLKDQNDLITSDLNSQLVNENLDTLGDYQFTLKLSQKTLTGIYDHYHVIDPDNFDNQKLSETQLAQFDTAWAQNSPCRWFYQTKTGFAPVTPNLYLDVIHDVYLALTTTKLTQKD